MKNTISLASNEILENFYEVNTFTPIKDVITSNILNDYSKGIKSARISIFPSDLTNTNNTTKKWSNGEIIGVGDHIKILNEDGNGFLKDSLGNEIIFRVIDRKTSYKGQVLIDLILQEVKEV